MMNDLEVAKKINVPGWMSCENVRRLMDVLNPEGVQTLFVGGAVRNSLLGQEVEDIDMATKFSPQDVVEILQKNNIRVIPTGIDHGTVTAVLEGRHFEITTLRQDVETDGRHAVVKYSTSWIDDARRRDFTMNTLLADIEGHIYDPLRIGLEDLENGTVIFVGEPKQRICEDYLRILRYFRFHGAYGSGSVDEDALEACRMAAEKISSLSKERITQEMFKIIASDDAYQTLDLMFKNKVLRDFFLSDAQVEFFREFCDMQDRYGVSALSSRLYALMNNDLQQIEKFEKFLIFPKVFLKDFVALDKVLALPDLDRDQHVKEAVYRCGRVACAQALMIEIVQDRVMHGYAMKALDVIQNWDVPDFPLSGADMIKAGIPPGPELGKELKRREDLWIKSGFKTVAF